LRKAQQKQDRGQGPNRQYYSAEFAIKGLGPAYQFRLWDVGTKPLCVLVKEDSEIVPWLKVGHVFDVKYYSAGQDYAPESLSTRIQDITKDEDGRFKGHYLVGLKILEGDETTAA